MVKTMRALGVSVFLGLLSAGGACVDNGDEPETSSQDSDLTCAVTSCASWFDCWFGCSGINWACEMHGGHSSCVAQTAPKVSTPEGDPNGDLMDGSDATSLGGPWSVNATKNILATGLSAQPLAEGSRVAHGR
jgi:hypothetical protein